MQRVIGIINILIGLFVLSHNIGFVPGQLVWVGLPLPLFFFYYVLVPLFLIASGIALFLNSTWPKVFALIILDISIVLRLYLAADFVWLLYVYGEIHLKLLTEQYVVFNVWISHIASIVIALMQLILVYALFRMIYRKRYTTAAA
jgi:hypothetical protein